MSRRHLLAAAILLQLATLAVAPVAAQPVQAALPGNTDMMQAPPVARTVKGPTRDVLAHDPVIQRQGDTWYLFTTGPGVSVWSSKDLRSWTPEAPVFARSPAWVAGIVADFNGHIWAPDLSLHDGVYTLYYSISAGGKNTSAIGVRQGLIIRIAAPAVCMAGQFDLQCRVVSERSHQFV